MSNFDVLGRKLGYQNQCRLNAFYSVQDIFVNLSACLYICVSVLLSIILVFPRFLSIRSKGRTNERTAIPNTVYPSLRERVE